jgi:hypothetical protein
MLGAGLGRIVADDERRHERGGGHADGLFAAGAPPVAAERVGPAYPAQNPPGANSSPTSSSRVPVSAARSSTV